MALVHISSKEQFSSLLTSSTIVVTDFYADWCGPCKAIAPLYEQLATQLSRPNQITFAKVNVDHQQEIARTYGVTAMPTFIMFKRGRAVTTIRGADTKRLSEAIQKLAAEATNMESGSGAAGESSNNNTGSADTSTTWLGASLPRNYSDVSEAVIIKDLDMLNRDSEKSTAKILFDKSKPSALVGSDDDSKGGKKKKKTQAETDWVESDTDEQLMVYIPFNSTLKVHSLQITSLPPTTRTADDDDNDDDDNELPMRPRTLRLYVNRTTILGFEEAEDITPVQTVSIAPEDWDSKTGTAKVELRFVKFQNVNSLVIFFVDGDGDAEKIRIDRIRVIGEAGLQREMGKLEKIGDEA